MSHAVVHLGGLLRTEWRLQQRHGVVTATIVLTGTWVAVLLAVPGTIRPSLVPWILFLDLAVLGLFVVPALAVVERANGVVAAVAMTRLSPALALAARLAVVAAMALVAGVAVAIAGDAWTPVVAFAVVLVSLLGSLLALATLGHAETLTTWLTRMPLVAVPLFVAPLLRGLGLWDTPVLAISPFTGALQLLGGTWSSTTAAWVVAWVVALWWFVVRRGHLTSLARSRSHADEVSRTAAKDTVAGRSTGWSVARASASLYRVDRRTVLGDGMVLALLAAIPLLAMAVRWLAGPGGDWLATRHGFDVTAYLPLAWTFLLAVHLPTIIGTITGLLFCEDRDLGVLPVIATTRATLTMLVGYRLVATALVAAAAVATTLPLAGARHPAGAGGVIATAVVAGSVAVVPALLMGTFARDRVQGVALAKVMALPLYLPVAGWFLDPPWDLALAPIPTAWPVRTALSDTVLAAGVASVVGVALSVGIATVLAGRLVRTVG